MNSTPFLPNLSPVQSKPLTAVQDAGNLSSNGGLVMLREAARQLGLADMIASRLSDERNPMCVRHTYADMIKPPSDHPRTSNCPLNSSRGLVTTVGSLLGEMAPEPGPRGVDIDGLSLGPHG